MNLLKALEFKVRVLLKRAYLPKVQKEVAYDYLGDKVDGGWPMIQGSVTKDSIIYSFGVGTNISWDEELIKRHGVNVFSFDPNPYSIEWLGRRQLLSTFIHHAIALGWKDSKMKFFVNRNNIAGCGMVMSKEHNEVVEVECLTITTIMNKFNHEHIDVVKIDIEGAEYEVIDSILESGIKITQLLLEFHHRSKGNYSIKDTKKAIAKLNAAGFKIFWRSKRGREVAFIKE